MQIGIDIVEVAQLARALRKTHRLLEMTFSSSEILFAGQLPESRRSEFLAGRFAVKEAVLKALGVGVDDFRRLQEIEVVSERHGGSRLKLCGSVAALSARASLPKGHVSITQGAGLAVALVVLGQDAPANLVALDRALKRNFDPC